MSMQTMSAGSVDVAMDVDVDTIEDEDTLKHMLQAAEDFGEKRRIRARMYKLREKRLKDFYTSDDVMTAGCPSAASLPTLYGTSSSSVSSSSAMISTSTTSQEQDNSVSMTTVAAHNTSSSRSRSSMSTSAPAMETEQVRTSNNATENKRKQTTTNDDEDDEVSEKIRRKSSMRTKRLQMVMDQIEMSNASHSNGDDDTASSAAGRHTSNTTTRVSSDAHSNVNVVTATTTCSEQRSADGTRVSRTLTNQRSGTQVDCGQDEESGASWTRRSTSTAKFQTTRTVQQEQPATHPHDHIGGVGMAQISSTPSISSTSTGTGSVIDVIDGVDINTCTDDFKLNELLDSCNDYEGRRKIRARIKALLTDNRGSAGDSTQQRVNSFGSSTVQSKTEVTTTRQSNITRSGQPGQSAFSKFQQLDQQSVKSSTR